GGSLPASLPLYFGVNAFLTAGNDFVQGWMQGGVQGGERAVQDRFFTSELPTILLNTVIMAGLHAALNSSGTIPVFREAGPTTVTSVDEANGIRLLGSPGAQYSPLQPDIAKGQFTELDAQGNPAAQPAGTIPDNNGLVFDNNGAIVNPGYVVYSEQGNV